MQTFELRFLLKRLRNVDDVEGVRQALVDVVEMLLEDAERGQAAIDKAR